MIPDQLTKGQFDTVYDVLSLAIAALLFTGIYMLAAQPRVLPRYRHAVVIGAIVCGIATFFYFQVLDSFRVAFVRNGQGIYTQAPGASFNEAHRYVDWLLTVPLLLVELVIVLAFAKELQASLLRRLIPASLLMIAVGYLGEISGTNVQRNILGLAATIPFAYIVYVLFIELTRSLELQPPTVRQTVRRMRLLLFASWGFYPIAYLLPLLDIRGADAWAGKQVGYTVADIASKAVYGLLIFKVARLKSFADDPVFAGVEAINNPAGKSDPTSASATRPPST